jgi:hypothetical protein
VWLQAWILEAIIGFLFVVDLLLGFHVQYAVRWGGQEAGQTAHMGSSAKGSLKKKTAPSSNHGGL